MPRLPCAPFLVHWPPSFSKACCGITSKDLGLAKGMRLKGRKEGVLPVPWTEHFPAPPHERLLLALVVPASLSGPETASKLQQGPRRRPLPCQPTQGGEPAADGRGTPASLPQQRPRVVEACLGPLGPRGAAGAHTQDRPYSPAM